MRLHTVSQSLSCTILFTNQKAHKNGDLLAGSRSRRRGGLGGWRRYAGGNENNQGILRNKKNSPIWWIFKLWWIFRWILIIFWWYSISILMNYDKLWLILADALRWVMLIMMGKMLLNRYKKLSVGIFIALTFLWPVFSLGNSKQKYELSSLKCVFCLDWCVCEPHIFWTAWRIHVTSKSIWPQNDWRTQSTCCHNFLFKPQVHLFSSIMVRCLFVIGKPKTRWFNDAGKWRLSRVDRPHAGFRNMASTRGAGVTCLGWRYPMGI